MNRSTADTVVNAGTAVVGDNVLAIMNSPYSEYPRQLLIYLQLLLGSKFSLFL